MRRGVTREGFDPAATGDPICVNDRAAQAFVPLGPALYRRILEGEVRL